MKKVVVADEFECQMNCIRNQTCKSFNVHPWADHNTKRVCELNNKTRQMKPGDLKKKKGSNYYGSLKGTCVDVSRDKEEKSNSGHCHPGYKGKLCQTQESAPRRESVTTTKRAPTTQPMKGWHSNQPAVSCKDIRDSGASRGDGEYWIDPEKGGNPLNVYCDMTTDVGGWLLISNVELSSTPPSQLPVKNSYRGINSDQMFLTKTAINELRTHLSFTQLRFYCSKQQGRTFHVITAANSSGEAVVQYFSGQTDVQPASCGSFVTMENDNSKLAGGCEKWNNGVWGASRDQDRLYNHAAYVNGANHWLLYPGGRWECDDFNVGVSSGDFWKVFVR